MMKCTFCGSEKLFKSGIIALPSGVERTLGFGTNAEDVFICLDCAHVEIFNNSFLKEYYDNHAKYLEIKEKINQLDNQINELTNKPFDENKYKLKLQQYQQELDILINLNVDNKSVRAKKDCIRDIEKILEQRVEPGYLKNINNLKYEKRKFEQELSKYDIYD